MSNRSPDQDRIDAFYRELCGEETRPNGNGLIYEMPRPHKNGHDSSRQPTKLTDSALLEALFGDKNGEKHRDIYNGDYKKHNPEWSNSEAVASILRNLAYYSGNDPVQMDRLIRGSGLHTSKFDDPRGGSTWLQNEIFAAIRDTPETVTVTVPTKRDGNGNAGTSNANGHDKGNDTRKRYIPSVSFAEVEEPPPAEEIVEGIFEKGWPSIIFGAAGAVKSIKAQSLGQAIADPHTHLWLEKDVITAPVMYADFELNTDAQARRAYQIARGRGRTKPPPDMRYMSTFGIPRRERKHFVENVVEESIKHKVEVCFIDSLGLAIQGDAGKFEDVVGMFEEDIAEFAKAGITPLLIGHQRRLQAGERNQSLGVYGSVFFENLARSLVQVEFVSRDRDTHTVLTRLRPKKANFSELGEPIEVKTTFHSSCPVPDSTSLVQKAHKKITLEVVELDDGARAGEETLTAKERVYAAISALGEAGPDEVTGECQTLQRTTVRKCFTALRAEGLIENTGEFEGRAQKVRVTVTVPFSGNGNGNAGKEADWQETL